MKKEAIARIKINKLLEESGWRFFDEGSKKANILLEQNLKVTQKIFDGFGENFEKTKNGFTDFTLLDDNGKAVAVLEAKSEEKHPLFGQEQARTYAKTLNVRYVILSNGNIHYFWDLETGVPQLITKLPTAESLGSRKKYSPNPNSLIKEEIGDDYIVITQKPDYKSDPDYNNATKKASFIEKNGLRFLRKYQIKAVQSIQKAVKDRKERFLFEMATGTGKTLVSAAVIKMFLKTKNAKRILFLVDRIELEEQAWKNFNAYLKNDYKCVIFKENREDWKQAEIVVSTIQTFMRYNRYKELFSPTDFDLVISDEAHRSIGGNSRAVFEFFIGYKLGLTATPKDYLKHVNLDKLLQNDQRKLERRELLDTYKTFGCEKSEPTFRYSLLDGVKGGFLVNPIVADGRTEITTELLSKEGYSVLVETEDGEKEEKIFFQNQFEKKFFSEETNYAFCKSFVDKALCDPISGEIGKTIVFCVSQTHAAKIQLLLNKLAMEKFPGKYQSDFAMQVSSEIDTAQQMAINFANNNLGGHTKFIDGYKSSKTRVCVTVGMMTTGYDCQDLLNVVLLRPIFSPTDFIQIKGRGTRKFTFKHKIKDEIGGWVEEREEKKNFKLFDYFGNCEYFEKDYPYDEELVLPVFSKKYDVDGKEKPFTVIEKVENYNKDPLKTYSEIKVSAKGMRIDRELFDTFVFEIKKDKFIKEKIKNGQFKEAEEYVKKELFNKPEEYFNLGKLQKAIKLDRRLSVREIIEHIFSGLEIKNRNELLEDEIGKFVELHGTDQKNLVECMPVIRAFMKLYITDQEFRKTIAEGNFGDLENNPAFSMKDLEELDGWREPLVNYVNDYVPLNTYTSD